MNRFFKFLGAALAALPLLVAPTARAETVTVTTYDELVTAAASEDVDVIIVGASIDITGDEIALERNVTVRAAENTRPALRRTSGDGGILTYTVSGTDIDFTLEGLTIASGDNTGGLVAGGVTVVAGSGTVKIKDCVFTGNAGSYGGGLLLFGPVSADVVNCAFIGNTADNHGGALCVRLSTTATVERCTFSGNAAEKDGGAVQVGLNDSDSATAHLVNSTFTGNKASRNGGALEVSSAVNVVNCTFFGNTANGSGPEVYNDDSGTVIKAANTIFWNANPCIVTTAPVSLDNCAFGANALGTTVVTSVDCVGDLNWADRAASSGGVVSGVPHTVFLLDEDADAKLIDAGLTADAVKTKLALDWTPNLGVDQLNRERDGTPDLGAWELMVSRSNDPGDDSDESAPSNGLSRETQEALDEAKEKADPQTRAAIERAEEAVKELAKDPDIDVSDVSASEILTYAEHLKAIDSEKAGEADGTVADTKVPAASDVPLGSDTLNRLNALAVQPKAVEPEMASLSGAQSGNLDASLTGMSAEDREALGIPEDFDASHLETDSGQLTIDAGDDSLDAQGERIADLFNEIKDLLKEIKTAASETARNNGVLIATVLSDVQSGTSGYYPMSVNLRNLSPRRRLRFWHSTDHFKSDARGTNAVTLAADGGESAFFLDENGVPTTMISGDASKMLVVAYLNADTPYSPFITVDATAAEAVSRDEIVEAAEDTDDSSSSVTSDKSSSSGCDAGFGLFGLLALLGLRRK